MLNRFGVGSVLANGFRVWVRNIVPFTLIALVMYIPSFIWASMTDPFNLDSLTRFAYVQPFLALLLDMFVTAAVTYGVVMEMNGTRASVGQCVGVGLKRFLPVLGTSIVMYLGIFGAAIATVFVLFFIPYGNAIAAAVVCFMLLCAWYVAVPAAVCERPGVFGALGRSNQLTRGFRWHIFAVVIVLGVIMFGVSYFVGTIVPVTSLKVAMYTEIATQLVTSTLMAAMAGVAYTLLRQANDGATFEQLVAVFE